MREAQKTALSNLRKNHRAASLSKILDDPESAAMEDKKPSKAEALLAALTDDDNIEEAD